MPAQEPEIDDIDLLLRTALQQSNGEANYDRVWVGLRERIEQQQSQQPYSHTTSTIQFSEWNWRLRCHWHTLEPTLLIKFSLVR